MNKIEELPLVEETADLIGKTSQGVAKITPINPLKNNKLEER